MGAWGAKAFENDDAMDWVYELEGARDASLVVETFESVMGRGEGCLDSPVGSVVLAAAEVVAALGGNPGAGLPDEVRLWVSEREIEVDRKTVDLASRAVMRVGKDPTSELKEPWDESGGAQEWYSEVDGLLARLNS